MRIRGEFDALHSRCDVLHGGSYNVRLMEKMRLTSARRNVVNELHAVVSVS